MIHRAPAVFVALGWLMIVSIAAKANEVGFRRIHVAAGADGRALHGGIWYPTAKNRDAVLIGDGPVFVGQRVHPDAPPLDGVFPLAVLSHGLGGNWRNQDWLATALVEAGWIVVAVNHPGTTSHNLDPETGRKLWLRVKDVHHVIDALTASPEWSARIDRANMTVIGHSLGAWTALEAAGARMSVQKLREDCRKRPGGAAPWRWFRHLIRRTTKACEFMRDFAIGESGKDRAMLEGNLRDTRLASAVSLEVGMARGFTDENLGAIDSPVLMIAAAGSRLFPELETNYVVGRLPRVESHILEHAVHFSFLPECKPGAATILEHGTPGAGALCVYGEKNARPAIHRRATAIILSFLAKHHRAKTR